LSQYNVIGPLIFQHQDFILVRVPKSERLLLWTILLHLIVQHFNLCFFKSLNSLREKCNHGDNRSFIIWSSLRWVLLGLYTGKLISFFFSEAFIAKEN